MSDEKSVTELKIRGTGTDYAAQLVHYASGFDAEADVEIAVVPRQLSYQEYVTMTVPAGKLQSNEGKAQWSSHRSDAEIVNMLRGIAELIEARQLEREVREGT